MSSRISQLMLEVGRARAQGQAQSGAIWGNAVQQLGQMFSQLPEQIAREKADAPRRRLEAMQVDEATDAINRDRAIREVGRLTGGDPEAYAREVALIDPEKG